MLLSVCTALEAKRLIYVLYCTVLYCTVLYCTTRFRLIFNKTGNVHINVTLRRFRVTIFAAKNITYSECAFVILGIQHAMRMPHTAICGLPGSTEFHTFSHKRHDLLKKIFKHKKCTLNLSINFVLKFLILKRTGRDMIKNVFWSSFNP
jgi:hypothetical protein